MKFVVKRFNLSYIPIIVLFELFPLKCYCDTSKSTVITTSSDPSYRRYFRKYSDSSINRAPLVVDLRHRAFKFVPQRILQHSETEMLDLGDNRLTDLPRELANLAKLEYLNLVDNRITNITLMNVVNEFPHLESLILSGNPLKSLNDLRTNSLLSLEAGYCEIEEINNLLSDSLPSLKTLNLTGNPLRIVPKLASKSLTNLILADCHLTVLSSDTFEGLRNLQYLELGNNALSTMPNEIFSNNNDLVHLSLSKNTFAALNNVWFEKKKKLKNLDLSENEITSIDEKIFAELSALIDLNLGVNRLVALPNLKTVAINVNVTKNFIETQEFWDLSDMTMIRSLDLSENRLDGDCGDFRSTSLRILDLGYNSITGIRITSFSHLPNLMNLTLKGNLFSHGFDQAIFEENEILIAVELDENPWECNCTDLFPIYFYLARGKRTITRNLICRYPEHVRGDSWCDVCSNYWTDAMAFDEQMDSSKNWLIGISSVFGVCLLVGTIVYIIYTFKKQRTISNL